jgi:hypothetical protein
VKVLVAAPFALNTPHYETALELMQLHLDQGDEALMLECDAAVPVCDANPAHAFAGCAECVLRRRRGLALLSRAVRTAPMLRLEAEDRAALQGLKLEFEDAEALKRYTVGGFDLGYGVLSSLISILRSAEPDLRRPAVRDLLRRFLRSTYAVYLSTARHLAAEKPHRVYVYNGRYASTRAVLRACQERGVECWIHEVGSTLQRYALYRNQMPHNLAFAERLIREAWDGAAGAPARRERLAAEYYAGLSRGEAPTWFAFTAGQTPGLMPPNWDPGKINIALYNSSEDEFAAISDEWRPPIYARQIDGLQAILEAVGRDDRYRLYLRVHPNLRRVRDAFTARLAALAAPNFTLIPGDSPVSSYALLFAASKVVTFGSSMGIEASFWGKRSILAGICMYRNLGATYNPRSHEELVQMLGADLPAMPKEGALAYGYYRATFGVPFRYFRARGVFDGEFKSVRLRPGGALRGALRGAQALGLGGPLLRALGRGLAPAARLAE